MARPSEFTKEIGDLICARLAEGESLRSVCLSEDMPNKSTVFRWFREQHAFRDQYAQAKEESSDAMYEKLEDIGDESINAAREADPKAANAVVSAYKLKADNLKWSMSKMKPKKYGDKLDLTSGGEKLPTPIMNVQRDISNEKDKTTE